MKVGDFVVERLHAWGVRRIYVYPGDGINGVIGALQRANKIEFIQVRHDEMAAFMAVAHTKFTGEIGVCSGDRQNISPDRPIGSPVDSPSRSSGSTRRVRRRRSTFRV
jgi:glyoxylate carboligase